MPQPGRGRKKKKDEDERLDVWGVRFEVVPLPSGMFTHRQTKVIIPARRRRPRKSKPR